MKYIIVSFLILVVSIISCNTGKDNAPLISTPSAMKADEYTITTDRDTILKTKNGALVKISQGTLTTKSGNKVTLEIKEAYTIEQMIRAGLTTSTNGEPLSSGGMIYINAAKGQDVNVTKPISISLPADYLDAGMQLYKGEVTSDGKMNWKDPDILPPNPQVNAINEGQRIFQTMCTSCHRIGNTLTGPDLANISKRPFSTLHDGSLYLHTYPLEGQFTDSSSSKSIEELYYCNLKKFFRTTGQLFDFDPAEKRAVWNYIQNESDRLNLPLPEHSYLDGAVDSCYQYNILIKDLMLQKEELIGTANNFRNNGELVTRKDTTLPTTITTDTNIISNGEQDKLVKPEEISSSYYQFAIESFGWYNIDVLIKGQEGVEISELFVQLKGEYVENVEVFLIIPSSKIYVAGGLSEKNPNEFVFHDKTGEILLPQRVPAYILGIKETPTSIAFAFQDFNVSDRNQINLWIEPATNDEFNTALASLKAPGLKITVADSKFAEKLRSVEKDISNIDSAISRFSRLKPRHCDCDCNFTFNLPDTLASPK